MKNLTTWLHATNNIGTSIMEEPTTNAQLIGAALIVASLFLFCVSCATFLVSIPAATTLFAGAHLIQQEGGES